MMFPAGNTPGADPAGEAFQDAPSRGHADAGARRDLGADESGKRLEQALGCLVGKSDTAIGHTDLHSVRRYLRVDPNAGRVIRPAVLERVVDQILE